MQDAVVAGGCRGQYGCNRNVGSNKNSFRQKDDTISFFREIIFTISHTVALRVFQSEGSILGFEGQKDLSAL